MKLSKQHIYALANGQIEQSNKGVNMSEFNIQQWCSISDTREHLKFPFNYDGRTIGCNGHCMISVPQLGEYPSIVESLIPAYEKNLKPFNESYTPLSTDIVFPEPIACETCKGAKKITVTECQECVGKCTVNLSNDFNEYTIDCLTCDGEGEITQIGVGYNCHRCLGYGDHFERFSYIEIDGCRVEAQYMRLLMELKSVEIRACEDRLHFRVDNVLGVILGLRQ